MATAHAKFTGEVGVCVATSSPGAFHMINGLYDAKMDNQPVVAIVGQQGLNALGTFTQQESNLERTLADVAVYVQTIVSPEQAQAVVDTAFRTARVRLGRPSSSFRTTCRAWRCEELSPQNWVSRSSAVAPSISITPPGKRDREGGRHHQCRQRRSPSSSATAPTAPPTRCSGPPTRRCRHHHGACAAKQVVPSDVPYHSQQLGLLGSLPSAHQMSGCDTLVLLGTNYPYGQFLPESGQARAIQVDLKPEQMGLALPHRGQPVGGREGDPHRAHPAPAGERPTSPGRTASLRIWWSGRTRWKRRRC